MYTGAGARFSTVSPVDGSGPASVFFAYRDAPERRSALAAQPGSIDRYRLFGLDEIAARRARVRHNLEGRAPGGWARVGDWLGPGGPPVRFIPFGVDIAAFRPDPGRDPEFDVVSVGADPRRDFALLTEIAARRPELGFRVVAGSDNARALGPLPPNVTVE